MRRFSIRKIITAGIVTTSAAGIIGVGLFINNNNFKPTDSSADNSHTLNVLGIGFDPSGGGQDLASKYYASKLYGHSASEFEDLLFSQTITDFQNISGGKVNYQLRQKIRITDFPVYPDGFSYDINTFSQCVWGTPNFNGAACEPRKRAFDYVKWFQDYNICQIMEQNDIDEVWIVSIPFIMAHETFMVGPNNGFDVNGPFFVVPGCSRHINVLGATYDGADGVLHVMGHRVEATMRYLTGVWAASDKQRYWTDFSSFDRYENAPAHSPTCGNAHFAANSSIAYQFDNNTTVIASCPDWKNFPDFTGITETINCQSWACYDTGWQRHWLGSIPDRPGEVTMTAANGRQFQFKKDWWYYLLDPDAAMDFVDGVLNGTPVPTASPSLSPSPMPSPSPSPTPSMSPTIFIPTTSAPTITNNPIPSPSPSPTIFTPPSASPSPIVTSTIVVTTIVHSPSSSPSPFPSASPSSSSPSLSPTPTYSGPTVVCGPMDVNGDGKLTVIDYNQFSKLYKRFVDTPTLRCSDNYPKTGCGGMNVSDVQDAGGNPIKVLNILDFASFSKRYLKASCTL